MVRRRAGRDVLVRDVSDGVARAVRGRALPHDRLARRASRGRHLDGRVRSAALGARRARALLRRGRSLARDPADVLAGRRGDALLHPAIAQARLRQRPRQERPQEERSVRHAPRRSGSRGARAFPLRALRHRGQVPARRDHVFLRPVPRRARRGARGRPRNRRPRLAVLEEGVPRVRARALDPAFLRGGGAMSSSAVTAPAAGRLVTARRLVLFDIDGTLLSAGPPARTAFQTALEDIFGTSGDIDGYAFEGRLDPLIAVSYTHLRAHETDSYLVCRLLL